jgi:protein-tyrosine phosphatase
MTPTATPRVLMVCLGNICRSPTAEAALREAADREGVALEVESAGTASWHVGSDPDPRTVAAGRELGLRVSGQGRQATAADFGEFDLLVAMDASNLRDLQELAPSPQAAARIRLFRDYEPGAEGRDVPDPYSGGADGFLEVVGMARRAADGLLARLVRGDA